MRILFFWLCLVITFSPSLVRAQENFAKEHEILTSIYKGAFASAAMMIDSLDVNNPYTKTLLALFLKRWQYIPVAYSEGADGYIHDLLKLRDELEYSAGTLEGDYYKITTFLMISEYEAANGNQWRAMTAAKRAYPLVMRCFKDSVPSGENRYIRGLYLYYAAHLRSNHVWGKLIMPFIKDGDKVLGLKLLSEVAFSYSLAGIEAAIYTAHILIHFENRSEDALVVCQRLVDRFPNNLKLIELYTKCLLACKQYEKAGPFVARLISSSNTFYHCAGYLFKGILEEAFYNNRFNAVKCYARSIRFSEMYPTLLAHYGDEARERVVSR